jgi:O-6-methylguanine DNA methyltransferase
MPSDEPLLPGLFVGSLASKALEAIRAYFLTGEPLDQALGFFESEDSSSGGERFDELLDGSSWTEFERQVYGAVMRIPHGETRTYSWVAEKIGRRGATRAVGQALRRNRHLIFVPCHRVVSSHDVGGYLGSVDPQAPEVQFKQRLLAWEHAWRNPLFSFLSA